MLTKKDFYVGQKLYIVPKDSRDEVGTLEVKSVGNRWVKSRNYCIDLKEYKFLEKRYYQLKDYGVRGRFFFTSEERDTFLNNKIVLNNILTTINNNKARLLTKAKEGSLSTILGELDSILDDK